MAISLIQNPSQLCLTWTLGTRVQEQQDQVLNKESPKKRTLNSAHPRPSIPSPSTMTMNNDYQDDQGYLGITTAMTIQDDRVGISQKTDREMVPRGPEFGQTS